MLINEETPAAGGHTGDQEKEVFLKSHESGDLSSPKWLQVIRDNIPAELKGVGL